MLNLHVIKELCRDQIEDATYDHIEKLICLRTVFVVFFEGGEDLDICLFQVNHLLYIICN